MITVDFNFIKKNTKKNIQNNGNLWLKENKSLCLKVSSMLINEEFNVLVNQNHSLFNKITVTTVKDFTFDKRLFHN